MTKKNVRLRVVVRQLDPGDDLVVGAVQLQVARQRSATVVEDRAHLLAEKQEEAAEGADLPAVVTDPPEGE